VAVEPVVKSKGLIGRFQKDVPGKLTKSRHVTSFHQYRLAQSGLSKLIVGKNTTSLCVHKNQTGPIGNDTTQTTYLPFSTTSRHCGR